MEELDALENQASNRLAKFALAAIIFAVFGLGDSIYLTVHHYTSEPLPCSIVTGCEQVLTSEYAEIAGIPTAAFGAFAYFLAFCLALLTIFGNRKMWLIFGAQTTLMFLFTLWLVYLQAFVISSSNVPWSERFCQFCLLSAITTTVLFLIALASKFWKYR